MKRGLVIVGLILLGAALVFLNRGVKNSALPDHDEDEQAQQTQPAQKPPSAPGSPRTVLPPEETVGNPATATHHIAVGWVYDEENQRKPETLDAALQAVRDYVARSGGAASAEIVDLDIPAEDRSPAAQGVTELGIVLDNQPVYRGSLSKIPGGPGIISGALTGPPNRK